MKNSFLLLWGCCCIGGVYRGFVDLYRLYRPPCIGCIGVVSGLYRLYRDVSVVSEFVSVVSNVVSTCCIVCIGLYRPSPNVPIRVFSSLCILMYRNINIDKYFVLLECTKKKMNLSVLRSFRYILFKVH